MWQLQPMILDDFNSYAEQSHKDNVQRSNCQDYRICSVAHPSLLLSWCFTSIETIRLIRDGKRGGGGSRVPISSSSARSDPQRPKRPPATARITVLRRCTEQSCIDNVHAEKQLLKKKTQQQDNPSSYKSPIPPPCPQSSGAV